VRRVFDMTASLFVRHHVSKASLPKQELTIFLSLPYRNA
jgi:hypothetical protein